MNTRPECPLVRERLPALLENDLPPGETLLVRAHVEGCEGCAAEQEGLAGLVREIVATRDESGFEAARVALGRALDSNGQDARPRVLSILTRRHRLVAAAAALVAIAGALFLAPPAPTLDELRLASRELSVPLDSLRPAFRLSDLGAASLAPGDAR